MAGPWSDTNSFTVWMIEKLCQVCPGVRCLRREVKSDVRMHTSHPLILTTCPPKQLSNYDSKILKCIPVGRSDTHSSKHALLSYQWSLLRLAERFIVDGVKCLVT